ncbi:secondary thiamine-phosphate synthase enzyme YjbQ [Halohasta litorea]|uniref:Secondary thiamine-phosphate synthase enzyme YjbQ n=1 Tax=Halohasta litorea TaxID=869891 RepID=A0ABD6DBX9_9EURY|nr:secondary thiamine-phosphate synthase enzyme YjbQ [Halohasta litorea]
MAEFTVETAEKTTVVDITDRVAKTLPADAEGVCTVFVRHTTAGVVVNENEHRLREDLANGLETLVPDEGWSHDTLDGNADSHVRAILLGESVTVPVRDGTLDLGRWQSVLFMECDGPRTRSVDVLVH